jgi:hypothetical protein
MPNPRLRAALIVLVAFLALTAIAGGVALLAGVIAPPVEMLGGSPFGSYLIPGLALLFVVGGSALAATVMLVRGHPRGVAAAVVAGAMIIGFEIVEVLVIGSPAGVARNLQVFYFSLGGLILVLAALLARRDR